MDTNETMLFYLFVLHSMSLLQGINIVICITCHGFASCWLPLSGFDGLGLLNGQFLSSTGSLVFGKQADLCQVRCALDNKFLRVNRFTISPEDNLMSS